MKHVVLILALFLFSHMAVAGGVMPAAALTAQQEKAPETATTNNTVVNKKLSSPRATVKSFLTAMDQVNTGKNERLSDAVATLDMSEVSALIRSERAQETAQLLYSVFQMAEMPEIAEIPKQIEQDSFTLLETKAGSVSLEKVNGGWLFSAATVENMPYIFQTVSDTLGISVEQSHSVSLPASAQLRNEMPAILKQGFLLEYWQWIGLFLIIVIGSVADKTLAWFLKLNVIRWKQKHHAFENLDETVLRPLGLMAMAMIWWSGLNLLGLPDAALLILLVAVKLLVSISGIWSAFRIVDIFDAFWSRKAARTHNKFDDLLVPMISKSLKVFVIVIGVVFAADNLNIDVTSLLAGLGLGGLAFALAAKDLLGNFFGSVTVLLDRPFSIGDWVVIGDIEGTVEEVGFRSTRIRTFYNSKVTMPNSILTTTKIDNMGARRYRRMTTKLAVTYDTSAEKIESFCEGIRRLIQLHPYMRKDYYQVYFNTYAAASLEILVYVFWEAPDWSTELRERHRFLLDVLRLAKQLEVEFAFPTQTLYLKQGDVTHAPAEAFQQLMTQDEAFFKGRQEAETIFNQTLGEARPGPVEFPR